MFRKSIWKWLFNILKFLYTYTSRLVQPGAGLIPIGTPIAFTQTKLAMLKKHLFMWEDKALTRVQVVKYLLIAPLEVQKIHITTKLMAYPILSILSNLHCYTFQSQLRQFWNLLKWQKLKWTCCSFKVVSSKVMRECFSFKTKFKINARRQKLHRQNEASLFRIFANNAFNKICVDYLLSFRSTNQTLQAEFW